MIFKKTLLSLLALALAIPAFAQPPEDAQYVQTTTLISETSQPLDSAEAEAFSKGPGRDDRLPVVAAGLIIMAGAKAWKVIVNGRPSADLASAYASAIPGFNYNWDNAADWRKVTRKYRFTMDNKVQGRAVDIVYEVSFFHGPVPIPGSNPVRFGRYLINFVIKPEAIDLKWGWKVSLSALMSHPMNIGTGEEPVAMLNADLKWQYVKPLTTEPKIGMNSVSVDGLGNLNDQPDGTLSIAPVPGGPAREGGPLPAWD